MATDVAGNLKRVVQSLPPNVKLVAVSKFHLNEELMAAYEQGQRIFGESHEQELSRKAAELPKDIAWHFIGHLQSNKVKYIAPYIDMIEAVDSLKLLREQQIRTEMTTAWRFFDEMKSLHFAHDDAFKERSWGMSHDYPIALQCGSTMVRVGTNIFGERQY